jgi:hypothetical protein
MAEPFTMTKKELRYHYDISASTLYRYLLPLKEKIDIKNRIFGGKNLALIKQTIEQKLKEREK